VSVVIEGCRVEERTQLIEKHDTEQLTAEERMQRLRGDDDWWGAMVKDNKDDRDDNHGKLDQITQTKMETKFLSNEFDLDLWGDLVKAHGKFLITADELEGISRGSHAIREMLRTISVYRSLGVEINFVRWIKKDDIAMETYDCSGRDKLDYDDRGLCKIIHGLVRGMVVTQSIYIHTPSLPYMRLCVSK
jgi:hypothetical protein